MIRIEIYYENGGKISGFRASGHSGTAEKGHDIVCAGVSALSQAALLGIGRHLHREMDYDVDPSGDLRMKLSGEPDDLTQAIFATMRLGFVEIAKSYPNAVSLKESRTAR